MQTRLPMNLVRAMISVGVRSASLLRRNSCLQTRVVYHSVPNTEYRMLFWASEGMADWGRTADLRCNQLTVGLIRNIHPGQLLFLRRVESLRAPWFGFEDAS